MSISFTWDNNDQTIMYLDVDGNWSLEDYYEGYLAVLDEIKQVGKPTVLLIDMSRSATPPARMMSTASFSKSHRADNIIYVIMVGAPSFIKALAEIMSRVVRSKQGSMQFAHTHEEARDIAYQRLALHCENGEMVS